jgi:hypothetical protein
MKGSDPTTYELIQKIQLLQKRLLVQAQAAVNREAQLQESERLCLNLHEVLSRQQGPELATRLQETQRVLKDRDKKIKVCHCVIVEVVDLLAHQHQPGLFMSNHFI